MGAYNEEDINNINAHEGFKVLCHTGKVTPWILKVRNENIIVKLNQMLVTQHKIEPTPFTEHILNNFKTKMAMFPIKDFSMFKPNPLGNNIYCYLGNDRRKQQLGYKLAVYVHQKTGFKILFGMLGNTIEYVKENYYDKCFVNFKPSITAGFTSAIELAYMGRKTISNAQAPFCIHYRDMIGVMDLITVESKKIGSVQPSCVGNYFDTGAEWKQVSFWQ